MRNLLLGSLLVLAATALPTLAQALTPVPYRSVPGPLMGAGLPVLLIGGGVYWFVRRRRKSGGGEPLL
jgi:LPXTG-motif cell wall-anchored protein